MNFFILGAFGLLGTRLSPYLESKGHNVYKLGKTDEEIKDKFQSITPDSIINLAANTNVDFCEKNPKEAYLSNVTPLYTIQKYIDIRKTHLIQVSTDQVYSGEGPHDESNPKPCNIYGLTKYKGELEAEKMHATILRTNYIAKSLLEDKLSLSDWFISSLIKKQKITLFKNIKFSPVHANYLCEIILLASEMKIEGTFNVASSDTITKSDFCLKIADELNLDIANVQIGISTSDEFRAPRPNDMTLRINKFEYYFSKRPPLIIDTIKQIALEYS